MGLKIWFPLNGNLNNIGCSSISIVNKNDAPIDNNGKIGQCYYLDDTTKAFYTDLFTPTSNNFSICCWYKATADNTNSGYMIGLSRASGPSFMLYKYSTTKFNLYMSEASSYTHNINIAQWHHYVITYNGTEMKLYIDGIYAVTKTKTVDFTTNTYRVFLGARSNNSNTNGTISVHCGPSYYNDLRYYDHCLSAAEVKEIAQGLVLHYKLDDITNGIQDSSGYGYNGTIIGTATLENSSPRYSAATYMNNTSTSNHIELTGTFPFTNPLSISFWVKSTLATNQVIFASPQIEFGTLNSLGYISPSSAAGFSISSLFKNNDWNHICAIRDNTTYTLYVNGTAATQNGASNYYAHNKSQLWLLNRENNNTYAGNASLSDFRIYCTALSADDILALYHTGAKIDNLQNLHTFEIKEANKNLLAGRLWTSSYQQHNPNNYLFTRYNSNGEPQFTSNSTSAGSNYIEINPSGHTYEYDITISVNAGNKFYIGFERYDADKTSRSNNATIYILQTKPSSDLVKQHFTGTIDLSTDGVNPCKYITLRILNGWSGTNSGVTGTLTIHNFSLREIGTKQQPKLTKQGQFIEEEIKEETNTKLHKNGIVETNTLIER